MQHEVYIAFSIHGTNAFITANNSITVEQRPSTGQQVQVGDLFFSVGASRTRSERDAIKLMWPALAPEGKPLTKPLEVFNLFDMLRRQGWTVDDAKFASKHSRSLTAARAAQERANKLAPDDEKADTDEHGNELTTDRLPFKPSQAFLEEVAKHNPEAAQRLATAPVEPEAPTIEDITRQNGGLAVPEEPAAPSPEPAPTAEKPEDPKTE